MTGDGADHGPTAAESADALNDRLREIRSYKYMVPSDRRKTPADMLREIAGIYDARKPLYRDNYKYVGRAMSALFPDGLTIDPKDEETWNRLHFIFHLYSKLSRYAMNLKAGGHRDSLDDLAVYAMLARECDEDEERRDREKKESRDVRT